MTPLDFVLEKITLLQEKISATEAALEGLQGELRSLRELQKAYEIVAKNPLAVTLEKELAQAEKERIQAAANAQAKIEQAKKRVAESYFGRNTGGGKPAWGDRDGWS